MEANEAQELQEQHEHAAHDANLRPVSFTMSVLAVLVAVTTVLGHRTHTEAVLEQAKASDQWNLYQAKKNRQYDTGLTADLLSALAIHDQAAADKITNNYKSHLEKWNEDLADEEKEARSLEAEVRKSERHADRFDLGEALLEIGLVITSITLLTRQRAYWGLGMAFGIAGVVVGAWAFFIR
jgi:predicted GIY-YIG superfamily endonuclease